MKSENSSFEIVYKLYPETIDYIKKPDIATDENIEFIEFNLFFLIDNKKQGGHVEYLLWCLHDFIQNFINNYPNKPILFPGRDDPVTLILRSKDGKSFTGTIEDSRHKEDVFEFSVDYKDIVKSIVSCSENLLKDLSKINPLVRKNQSVLNLEAVVKKFESAHKC